MIGYGPILKWAVFLSLSVFMFFLEGKYPKRSWTDLRKHRLWFSIKLALINNLLMGFVVFFPFAAWTQYVSQKELGLAPWLGLEGIPLILSTIVFFDFLTAVKHLMYHRIPLLWRLHRPHHTDTHLDVLTALRYHPGEFMFSALIKASWIALWGPSVVAFVCFEIALNIFSQFHHSNIDLPDSIENFLNKFIVTPRYHAIHHTICRNRGDQNFAVIFTLWDRILRSHTLPKTSEIALENLQGMQDKHLSLADLLHHPFKYGRNKQNF